MPTVARCAMKASSHDIGMPLARSLSLTNGGNWPSATIAYSVDLESPRNFAASSGRKKGPVAGSLLQAKGVVLRSCDGVVSELRFIFLLTFGSICERRCAAKAAGEIVPKDFDSRRQLALDGF
jgi:hypothetical protein